MAKQPLTIRIEDADRHTLNALASQAGVSVSEYIRRLVTDQAANTDDRLDDHERRLTRLEGMAGL